MKAITLKPKAEKAVARRHPWLFSGGIARVDGRPDRGETVEVLSSGGQWLARAAYSPDSQIRARIWTWDEAEVVDEDFLRTKLLASINRRSDYEADPNVTAFREVFAESDGIPGLILDRYADIHVVQFLSSGSEYWRSAILDQIGALGGTAILDRSDAEVRALEGLSSRVELVSGEVPIEGVEILEQGLRYKVDLYHGHKTGFYLDQRPNRRLASRLLQGPRVLNCFAYTGGFTLAALKAGANEVVSIDTSEAAIDLAKENVRINQMDMDRCRWIVEDVFVELRAMRDNGEQFDAVVLDPPRFASSARQVKRAARGYKDINLLAFKLLKPGGVLMTFSCSGNVDEQLFQKIVADAALDAGVEASIEARLSQAADHPVRLSFPEARYLKGFVCRTWK